MAKERVRKIDVMGETCPVPLVETRKVLRKADEGEIIEVIGNHPASKDEIPMAIKELGLKLLSVEDTDDGWLIKIKNTKE
ncbi:MAG: sulfurtransferase TusA family protein [Thermoplasmata archaeon]